MSLDPAVVERARRGLPPAGFDLFDVHAHVGDFGTIPTLGLDVQLREMDRLGIRTAVVSSIEAIYGDVRGGNDDVIAALRAYPGRFAGYCYVTAQYPELMEPELERCFAVPGFAGLKVYQVGTDYDHALFEPAWKFARERGVPVLAHTWGGNLTGLDRAALKFPEVPFLAGHAGSGFAYQAYIDAAARTPNLYLDLTYSREHTNMIERFVECAGPDRIVWGTDAPTFSMSHQLGKVLLARIPEEAKRKILHDNAERLFSCGLSKRTEGP